MPFETKKPSGSRKVWRAKGAGGGSGTPCCSGDGGLRAAAEREPHGPGAPGEAAHHGTAPCAPAGDPSLNGDDLPSELPANPAKQIISLLRHTAAVRRSRNGVPGRGVQLGWAQRPGCSDGIKSERSRSAQTGRAGSETADLAGGVAPTRAPLRAPSPLPSPCPPRLLSRALPTPSEEGVSPPRASPALRRQGGCRVYCRSGHPNPLVPCRGSR